MDGKSTNHRGYKNLGKILCACIISTSLMGCIGENKSGFMSMAFDLKPVSEGVISEDYDKDSIFKNDTENDGHYKKNDEGKVEIEYIVPQGGNKKGVPVKDSEKNNSNGKIKPVVDIKKVK